MAESSSWDDWERVIRDPDSGPLDVLKAAGVYQGYLAAIEQAAAKAARAAGNTWEEIGDAIGVTRQSAWQRLRTLKAPDLQELLLARGQQENLSGLALQTARQMASRFQPPASVRESARGAVSYVVVSLDGVPVCALWAGSDKREAGVVPARGHEREAQQWWWLLLSAATSEDFHATDFVDFWAREGRAGYAVSEVHDAASVESLRARMRDIAACVDQDETRRRRLQETRLQAADNGGIRKVVIGCLATPFFRCGHPLTAPLTFRVEQIPSARRRA